ncbi:TniQ family protein [Burkholderia arboris]|nr:TniQ family protein [Burkholderia arboris]
MVEALHSLVVRLAHAHVVKPAVLVKEEILRDCEINYTKYSAKFVTTYLSTMNGLGKYAREILTSVENLTMQPGLDACTFLRWDELFDYRARRMLHLHPHWCPLCFASWRQNGVEPYYPLIWQSIIVLRCPVHFVSLEQKCPSCLKVQPFVPRHYYLDHCSHCGSSLALHAEKLFPAARQQVPAADLHAIDTITEMITQGQKIHGLLTAEHFWSRLQETADKFYDGNVKAFERSLGFAEGTFSNWKLGRHKPSFSAFYKFACKLDTTPVAFLVGGAPDRFSAPAADPRPVKKTPTRLTAAEQARLQRALRAIIDQGHSHHPMRNVAAQLGYRHTFMIYWFRDECRLISKLHRQWVASQANRRANANRRLALKTVDALYTSRRRVTRKLIDETLGEVGLSLQDPVVRDAVYAIRARYLKAGRAGIG